MICKQQSRIHNGKSKRTLAKMHPRMEMGLVTLVVGRIYDFWESPVSRPPSICGKSTQKKPASVGKIFIAVRWIQQFFCVHPPRSYIISNIGVAMSQQNLCSRDTPSPSKNTRLWCYKKFLNYLEPIDVLGYVGWWIKNLIL